MKKKARFNNLSFLDVLFGALGAVLILFIIMLSMSGAPPRQRSPIHRTLNWTFVLPDTNPVSVQIFNYTDNIEANGDFDKEFTADDPYTINPYLINISTSIEDPAIRGGIANLTIHREAPNGKDETNTLDCSLELLQDDSAFSSGMCLLIKLSNDANPNSCIPKSAEFSVNPSLEKASPIAAPEKSGFICKFVLQEVKNGEGLMPSVLFFRDVDVKIQEATQ